MAGVALRYTVLLLLGAAKYSAAAGIDGGLGAQTAVGAPFTAATAISGGRGPDGHDSAALAGTGASGPAVHLEFDPFTNGVASPGRGRRLLHGCHGKRTADRSIFLKCGPPSLLPGDGVPV